MKKISFILAVLLICSLVLGSCGKKEEKPYDYDLKEYVTLGEFPNVTLDKAAIQKAVDKAVEEVASTHKVMTEVTDRAVKNDDTVNIKYVGKINGEEFDGGKSESYDLVIGSGSFIPGFEEGLVGKKLGETVDLQLKFPENYHNAEVAGKDVVFTVTINKISVETIPPLSDDMVRGLNSSEYTTVSEFLEVKRKTEAESVIWDNYLASCKVIKYPEKETKELYDSSIEYYKMMAINLYGMTLEDLIVAFGYATLDDFFAQTLNDAKMSVKETMIIYSTVRTYGITVSDEEYQTLALSLAQESGYTTVKEYEEVSGKETIMLEIYKNKIIEMALEANGIFNEDFYVEEEVGDETTGEPVDTDTPVPGGSNESATPETDKVSGEESNDTPDSDKESDVTESVTEEAPAVSESTTDAATSGPQA